MRRNLMQMSADRFTPARWSSPSLPILPADDAGGGEDVGGEEYIKAGNPFISGKELNAFEMTPQKWYL